MVDLRDACTLTDVCISDDLPEIELVSLLSESLPQYRLRVDTVTDFTNYHNEDWGIRPPPSSITLDPQLTNAQIREVFKYFILCGERVSQMTRVYDDIEAVTHLLEEKEKDLELAARIGQSLLEQNKHLVCKCEKLEAELLTYQEQAEQLKYDLTQKEQLLKLLSNEEQVDSRQTSSLTETSTSKYVEVVQRKLTSIEEENSLLRSELSRLQDQTQQLEEQEQKLTTDCVIQLNEAQKRIKKLQAEADSKGHDLLKCQEECSTIVQQLVSGQQKLKELTIENLDMKESLKISDEVQKELTSELFELKDKYKECKDMLDCSKSEISQLKAKSSPKVATQRYYTLPHLMPPVDSFAAELESLNSGSKDASRKTNSRVMETAQYVRKLSSKPSSLTSSMSSNSGRPYDRPGKNPLLATPIPGSAVTKPSAPSLLVTSASLTSSTTSIQSSAGMMQSSSFFDEIERHRRNLGRPGIPGSKDLDKALKRLSLRRQNERSEAEFLERQRTLSSQTADSEITSLEKQLDMEWSETSTPTIRSPSPESELSGYGSASSFGYRMPEKLQIVKPLEGSATLHHWQRLATPNMAGIFEEREGVQIKHEERFRDLDSTTYSLLDVEEEVAPIKGFGSTQSTFTVTDARVLHPATLSSGLHMSVSGTQSSALTTSTSAYRYGVISRFGIPSNHQVNGIIDLPSALPTLSTKMSPSLTSNYKKNEFKTSENIAAPPSIPDVNPSRVSANTSVVPSSVNTANTASVTPNTQSYGILSSFYQYLKPGLATQTTQSGLTAIVSDHVFDSSRAGGGGAFGRWQSPW